MPEAPRARRRAAAWLLSGVGALALAWLAGRKLPLWPERWAPVDSAWLALALALALPYMWTRAHRLVPLLEPHLQVARPGARLRPALIQGSGWLSFFVVLALPFRLGELSRPMILARAEIPGVRFEEALGAQAAERIVDGLCVVALLFAGLAWSKPASAALGDVREVGRWAGLTFGTLVVVGLVVARVPSRVESWARALTPASVGERLAPRLARIAASIQPLYAPATGVRFTAWTLVYWSTTVLQLWALARGFGLEMDLGAAAACVAIVGLSIQLPGGPAQLGSFQVGMASALTLYLPASQLDAEGASFAVGMYSLQLASTALASLPAMLLLRRARHLGPIRGGAEASPDAA